MFYLLNMVIFHMVNILYWDRRSDRFRVGSVIKKAGSNGHFQSVFFCLCLKMGYTQEMAIKCVRENWMNMMIKSIVNLLLIYG